MDFKKATDELMRGLTRAEIAEAIGRSEATVRQARLPEDNAASRSAPQGWERPMAKLAKREAKRLLGLAKALEKTIRD